MWLCLYMNFPHTRHFQRYEYIVQAGHVNNRTVADLGCGTVGVGAFLLTSRAKFVFAIDEKVDPNFFFGTNDDARRDRLFVLREDLRNFETKVDVVVAVEVFEHMPDAEGFVSHISEICDFAFITTPLVETTGKTVNPAHVKEYSAGDFDRIVSRKFDIIDKVYQHADLSITKEAVPHGDSFNFGHVVQMVWARNRNGKRKH